ncbi:HAD domain-containing protein [Streptomyces violascens]|uniref:HAD domain-containing protein n=1 Tax=Streptomyces violascens TaxID=67381 RepID=UPI001672F1F0|nr:HAD domain-containing protein [Streptomyces violascens]GGU40628.1 hypothetical protein GCM10010289_71940 [Streptomyces violascens]
MPNPLLLLDIDGVLNPFQAAPPGPAGYHLHLMRPQSWIAQHPHLLSEDVPDLQVRLHPEHGAELLDLPFDLAWASTWEDDANRHISPAIGLPALPVINWTNPDHFPADGTYFKTADVVSYAAGRPFAWVDDQIHQADRDYVSRNHPGPALLYDVDPEVGLTLDDFEALAHWAGELTLPRSA